MKFRASTWSHLTPAAAFIVLLHLPCTVWSGDVPFLAGRVNDTADLLSSEKAHELELLLKAHEDSTSNQVAVLTIPGLEGDDLEQYSIRVVDTWKLGQKGKDNGVLLLVVRDDRKVRIEVGRGLEGNLPDITCGLIIRREILPRFKQGDYEGGIQAGVLGILAAIRGAYTAQDGDGTDNELLGKIIGALIFILVVGVFTVLAAFMRGSQSWFLYFFLYPFWFVFPLAFFGFVPAIVMFLAYAIGGLVLKIWFGRSDAGKAAYKRLTTRGGFLGGLSSGGTWSSGGGSSSGGGFSGGGGGFSGGGASGSW